MASIELNKRLKSFAIALPISLSLLGCVESKFELASDSRLPKWFSLPSEMTRSEVSVVLTHFTSGTSNITLVDRREKTISTIQAQNCWHPDSLKKRNSSGGYDSNSYPLFTYIQANGMLEVLEYRKMEPIFRVSDDPALRKGALEATKCDKG
jgi:hypothetical protein